MAVQPEAPTVGRIVWYQTDGRGGLDYYLPAIVVTTPATHAVGSPLDPPANDLAPHLRVFSPGVDYVEMSVPHSFDGAPRTWRWPERS